MNLKARSDSVQNKVKIVKTALNLFMEKGIDIPLTEIAKESDVSRMTFYRHFPDREALVSAVFHYNLDQLDLYAKALHENKNGFYLLLKKVLIQRVEYHNFLPYINGQEQTLTSSRLFEIFEKPIQLAKNSNLLRDDFCCEKDLLILISMVGGAVAYVQMSGQSAIERTLELLMNGIKVVTKE
ncbi:TetR/AcrR family transcriptional regulator [Chryseobacterium binzhouense]|uniref:TetR/AcrR family transcriptional regulator n=1 Tax=Chryseobacterium binzhouense TaxID=2593646 RepID=UPI0011803DA0|nr:TetR/AcrR family transcriptional regulator [Chryseobacterium binzhouense]